MCQVTGVPVSRMCQVSGVPVSRMRRCSRPVGRNDSSLQERIFVPTSSELVARIRAFSSLRLTPAMDATSLMSSSSLRTTEEERRQSRDLQVLLPVLNVFHEFVYKLVYCCLQ